MYLFFTRCKAIACDPNWDDSRWFVTLNENNQLNVWDLDKVTVVRGHRALCAPTVGANDGGAVCITADRQVLTIAGQGFASFCLRSNTYSMFREDFVVKKRRQRVSLLHASPFQPELIALGYNDGLVEIKNIKSECEVWRHINSLNINE